MATGFSKNADKSPLLVQGLSRSDGKSFVENLGQTLDNLPKGAGSLFLAVVNGDNPLKMDHNDRLNTGVGPYAYDRIENILHTSLYMRVVKSVFYGKVVNPSQGPNSSIAVLQRTLQMYGNTISSLFV